MTRSISGKGTLPRDFYTSKTESMWDERPRFENPDYNRLWFNDCDLTEIPNLLQNIKDLYCYNCKNLTFLPKDAPKLVNLVLYNCPKIQSLPQGWTKLTKIEIKVDVRETGDCCMRRAGEKVTP